MFCVRLCLIGEDGWEIRSPAYDFNDAALLLEVGFFTRLLETRMKKSAAWSPRPSFAI